MGNEFDWRKLEYKMPPDVLHYEQRVAGGLSAQALMLTGMIAVMGLTVGTAILKLDVVPSAILAVLAAAGTLLVMVKPDSLGGRSIPSYLIARSMHGQSQHVVTMPMVTAINPKMTARVKNIDGVTVATIGEG